MEHLRASMENIQARAKAIGESQLDGIEAVKRLIDSGCAFDRKTKTQFRIIDDSKRVTAFRRNAKGEQAQVSERAYITALQWLIKPLDDELLIADARASVVVTPGRVFDIPVERVICPFGCGHSTKVGDGVFDAAGNVKRITWKWDACPHFVGARTELDAAGVPFTMAYFAAYDMRYCDTCEDALNGDEDEECWNCGGDTFRDSRWDGEPDDD